MRTCFVSIDVEPSYAQTRVGASEDKNPFESIDKLDNILNIFRKHNISATLFVTGEVLEYSPDLVKKWSKDFEIGCHNYWHVQLDKIDSAEKERQVKDFVNLYKNIFGILPKGFRAPRNVIDNEQFPILERYGFIYDASVFPRYPWRIGAYTGYRGRAPILPYWPDKKDYRKKACPVKSREAESPKETFNEVFEIPESPASFDVPFVGTWLRKLGVRFFKFIFKIKKPKFISFSMHSWDGIKFEGKSSQNSGKEFLKQLDEMLRFLKSIGYEFKNGEQIYEEFSQNK